MYERISVFGLMSEAKLTYEATRIFLKTSSLGKLNVCVNLLMRHRHGLLEFLVVKQVL